MPQGDGRRIAETTLQKNRTTAVPATIREDEGLESGDKVEWRLINDEWVLRPAEGGE